MEAGALLLAAGGRKSAVIDDLRCVAAHLHKADDGKRGRILNDDSSANSLRRLVASSISSPTNASRRNAILRWVLKKTPSKGSSTKRMAKQLRDNAATIAWALVDSGREVSNPTTVMQLLAQHRRDLTAMDLTEEERVTLRDTIDDATAIMGAAHIGATPNKSTLGAAIAAGAAAHAKGRAAIAAIQRAAASSSSSSAVSSATASKAAATASRSASAAPTSTLKRGAPQGVHRDATDVGEDAGDAFTATAAGVPSAPQLSGVKRSRSGGAPRAASRTAAGGSGAGAGTSATGASAASTAADRRVRGRRDDRSRDDSTAGDGDSSDGDSSDEDDRKPAPPHGRAAATSSPAASKAAASRSCAARSPTPAAGAGAASAAAAGASVGAGAGGGGGGGEAGLALSSPPTQGGPSFLYDPTLAMPQFDGMLPLTEFKAKMRAILGGDAYSRAEVIGSEDVGEEGGGAGAGGRKSIRLQRAAVSAAVRVEPKRLAATLAVLLMGCRPSMQANCLYLPLKPAALAGCVSREAAVHALMADDELRKLADELLTLVKGECTLRNIMLVAVGTNAAATRLQADIVKHMATNGSATKNADAGKWWAVLYSALAGEIHAAWDVRVSSVHSAAQALFYTRSRAAGDPATLAWVRSEAVLHLVRAHGDFIAKQLCTSPNTAAAYNFMMQQASLPGNDALRAAMAGPGRKFLTHEDITLGWSDAFSWGLQPLGDLDAGSLLLYRGTAVIMDSLLDLSLSAAAEAANAIGASRVPHGIALYDCGGTVIVGVGAEEALAEVARARAAMAAGEGAPIALLASMCNERAGALEGELTARLGKGNLDLGCGISVRFAFLELSRKVTSRAVNGVLCKYNGGAGQHAPSARVGERAAAASACPAT